MIEKIISGGQTGSDQAALQAAKKMGIPRGGRCPKDGLDENGQSILKQHPLLPTIEADPSVRTKLNIKDSDGTFIFVPCWPLPKKITDGTQLTINEAKSEKKPFWIVNLSMPLETSEIANWIAENNIKILNVAGPRESSWPGIFDLTLKNLEKIFQFLLKNNQIGSVTPRAQL